MTRLQIDAYNQNDPIMIICECSDIIGAIKHYVSKFNLTIDDLISFNNNIGHDFTSSEYSIPTMFVW